MKKKWYLNNILYLRDVGTFKRNRGGIASSNKLKDCLLLFSFKCSWSILCKRKLFILTKNRTLGWWDIFAFPRLFLTKIFFFYYYLVPKLIKSLNSCVMMKNSTLKTYEQSQKVSKFVQLLHLYEIKKTIPAILWPQLI